MINQDYLEALRARCDEVLCRPRLYPTRIYALQLLTGQALDELIDNQIVQPLTSITETKVPVPHYRFSPETVKPHTFNPTYAHQRLTDPDEFGLRFRIYEEFYDPANIPQSCTHQFLSDLSVFGLREAILFFNTYEFVHEPADLFNSAVDVYHKIAKNYIQNVMELDRSKDERISNLMNAARAYGEGTPPEIKTNFEEALADLRTDMKERLADSSPDAISLTSLEIITQFFGYRLTLLGVSNHDIKNEIAQTPEYAKCKRIKKEILLQWIVLTEYEKAREKAFEQLKRGS